MTQTSNQNHENRKTPPVSVKEAGGSDNTAMGSRFRELLGILRRHDLVRGLTPEKLRAVLEDMGPTFIKLGQIMSMHPDMLPKEYCQELSKLRADVKPLPFSEIKGVIEEEYKLPIQEVFAHIEKEPLGSASIAQVHKASLPDGRQVVLKVQRPGIQQVMANDILLLRKAAGLLKLLSGGDQPVDLDMVLTEMWAVAQEEMNFLKEAGNLLGIESKKIKQKVQLVLYMPNFISVIVLCGIVRVLLSVTGPVNGLLHTSINFMTLPEAFRPIYIISGIWQGAGWASIMYTASLSNASKDLKEAAMIDGANLIQQIMTVEWPAIKDMVVIQFILQAGNIMSIGFEKAYALQTDLNLNTAEIIATYVYKKGLLDGDYSFSTAVGLFNTVVNVILLIAVNKVVAKMNDGKGL